MKSILFIISIQIGFVHFAKSQINDSSHYGGDNLNELLQYAKTLEFVNVSRMSKSDILLILSQCSNLKTLVIDDYIENDNSNNQVSEVKTDINFLIIENSDLRNIPKWVFACSKLQYLSLSNNRITHLDSNFHRLSKLEKLDLSYNRIRNTSSIQILNNINGLTELDLNGSKRLKLESGLEGIEILNLSNRKLRCNQVNRIIEFFPSLTTICLTNEKYFGDLEKLGVKIDCPKALNFIDSYYLDK